MDMKLILCATDGSEAAAKALDFASGLAKLHAARLLVLHVQRKHGRAAIPSGMEDLARIENVLLTEADMMRDAAVRMASEAANMAKGVGVADVESMVVEGDAATRIIEIATEKAADAIVIGSRGLGDLEGLLLGSVSHKVAHLAPCTCVVVR